MEKEIIKNLRKEYIGQSFNDCYFLLKEEIEKMGFEILPMRISDYNIDTNEKRICVWIDDEGEIYGFTQG